MGNVCRHRASGLGPQALPANRTAEPWVLVQGLPQEVQQHLGQFVLPSPAKLRWKRAVRHITLILRIRRRWALTGQYLQQERIQNLVAGLERRNGRLVRRRPAQQQP